VEKQGADAVQAIINDKRLTAVFERAGLQSDAFRLAQVLVARDRYWPGDDRFAVNINYLVEDHGEGTESKTIGTFYGMNEALPEAEKALKQAEEKRKTDPTYRVYLDRRNVYVNVADIVKSEAGMATLMDRKVNRGSLKPISDVAAVLVRKYNLTDLNQLAKHERELVQLMKYRTDFLVDPTLSQPAQ